MSGMQKRKRGDRAFSADNGQRPPPHSPETLDLGRQSREFEQRGRGHGSQHRGGPGRGRGRGSYNANRRGSHQHQDRHDRDRQSSAPTTPTQRNPLASPFPHVDTTASNNMAPPPTPQKATGSEPLAPFRTSYPTTSGEMVDIGTMTVPEDSEAENYHWEIITAELSSAWDEAGFKSVNDYATPIIESRDMTSLHMLYEELLMAGIAQRIPPHKAGEAMRLIWQQDQAHLNTLDTEIDIIEREATFRPVEDAALTCLDAISTFSASRVTIVLKEIPRLTHPLLTVILRAVGISPDLMRKHLAPELLVALGMVRPKVFEIKAIRGQTNELYRQEKFNLMREETEGYAKLVTELSNLSSITNPSVSQAKQSFERVKALIGAFSLEPGRVLDIVMDMISAVLVRRYRFFIKFLRASTWWPQETIVSDDPYWELKGLPLWALQEFEGASITEQSALKEKVDQLRQDRDRCFWSRAKEVGIKAFFELNSSSTTPTHSSDMDWEHVTGTAAPSGNRVAAQLLGFKLRYYSSGSADAKDKLLANVINLAALLIKTGFISLVDLYPHLYPLDKDMEKLKETKMAERVEEERRKRPGAGIENALTKAAALTDDTLPGGGGRLGVQFSKGPTATATTSEDISKARPVELPEPEDQKVMLLRSLLCIGAIPESLFMLGKFPWLFDAYPDLIEYLHRILRYSISHLAEKTRPLRVRDDLRRSQLIPALGPNRPSTHEIHRVEEKPRIVHRWASLDKEDDGKGNRLAYYWDDWADQIPVCRTDDELFTLCATLMNVSGVKIGHDVELLINLARVGRSSLDADNTDTNLKRWIDLSKRLIVPALSLTGSNIAIAKEVYGLIERFDLQTRYSIYSEWFSGPTSRLPDIKAAIEVTKAQTRDILKRISKTNTKQMAQALAKVTYSSPAAVFSVALSQIESYDNLSAVVIECAEHFTPMGYDVLTWSLLSALGGPTRDRVQSNGLLTSRWLTALSQFTGQVFRRYPAMMPSPLLQYVYSQLDRNQTSDLIVLKEIITSMGGLISDVNFTETQTYAMAGGPVLQHQILVSLGDSRHEAKRSSQRLMQDMIKSGLARNLLLSLANQERTAIYSVPDDEADLKILGSIQDGLHETLGQYLELLRTNLRADEFDKLIPGLVDLIALYNVEPKTAFWISRDSLARSVRTQIQSSKPTKLHNAAVGQASQYVDSSADSLLAPSSQAGSVDVPMPDQELDAPDKSDTIQTTDFQALERGFVAEMVHALATCLPGKTERAVPTSFYFTFWQLSLHDILVPSKAYEDENKRLTTESIAITKDRSDLSSSGLRKREERQARISAQKDRVNAEFSAHIEAKRLVSQRLRMEKDEWFAAFAEKRPSEVSDGVLQYCVLPRAMMSSIDASFSFRFLKAIHQQNAANFRTADVYGRLFKENRLRALIFLSTTAEATNLGFFLNEVLRDLHHWHSSKVLYEKEAFGPKRDYIGFAKSVKGPNQPDSLLDHVQFAAVLSNWHRSLFSAIRQCLDGGEYMHISNAITVLRAVYQFFPRITVHGQSLLTSLSALKSESREDLKLSANALYGLIKRKEKDWRSPASFRMTAESDASRPSPRPTTRTPRSNTPQPPSQNGKQLNASARDFKPSTSSSSSQVDMRKPSEGSNEALEAARKKLIQDREAKEEAVRAAGKPAPRIDDGRPEKQANPQPPPRATQLQVDVAPAIRDSAPLNQAQEPVNKQLSQEVQSSSRANGSESRFTGDSRAQHGGRQIQEAGRLERPFDFPPIQRQSSEARFDQPRNSNQDFLTQGNRRFPPQLPRDSQQTPSSSSIQVTDGNLHHSQVHQPSQDGPRLPSGQMMPPRKLDPSPVQDPRNVYSHGSQQGRNASSLSRIDRNGFHAQTAQGYDAGQSHPSLHQRVPEDGWESAPNSLQPPSSQAPLRQPSYSNGNPPTEPRSTRASSLRNISVNGYSNNVPSQSPPQPSPNFARPNGSSYDRRHGEPVGYERNIAQLQESTYGRLNQDPDYPPQATGTRDRRANYGESSHSRPHQPPYPTSQMIPQREYQAQLQQGPSRFDHQSRPAGPHEQPPDLHFRQQNGRSQAAPVSASPVSPADLAGVHPSRLNAVASAAGVPPSPVTQQPYSQQPNPDRRDRGGFEREPKSHFAQAGGPYQESGSGNRNDTSHHGGHDGRDRFADDGAVERRFAGLNGVLNRELPQESPPQPPFSQATQRDIPMGSTGYLRPDPYATGQNGESREEPRRRTVGHARERSRSPVSSRGEQSYRNSPREREPLRSSLKSRDLDLPKETEPDISSARAMRRGERERERDRPRDWDRDRLRDRARERERDEPSSYRSSRGGSHVDVDRNNRQERNPERTHREKDESGMTNYHGRDGRDVARERERDRERDRAVERGVPAPDLITGSRVSMLSRVEGGGRNDGWNGEEAGGQPRRSMREKRGFEMDTSSRGGGAGGRETRRGGQ